MRLFFFILYFIFMTFTLIFILIKVINLFNSPTVYVFPERCLPKSGCARIMVWDDDHRASSISENNRFTIQHIGLTNTQDFINQCIDRQSQSRLQNKNISETSSFYHINFSSFLWGLVDDMFIDVIPCTESSGGLQVTSLGLNIQSQVRLGSGDFGVNPGRIASFIR